MIKTRGMFVTPVHFSTLDNHKQGWQPILDMLDVRLNTTFQGHIKTDYRLMSSLPGPFASGDTRDKNIRQVIAACSDGARTSTHAFFYLEK